MARRLILDINRNVESLINEYDEAIAINDPAQIQRVNENMITVEQSANYLRSMTEVPPQLRRRITDALLRADNLLATHETIQPQVRTRDHRP